MGSYLYLTREFWLASPEVPTAAVNSQVQWPNHNQSVSWQRPPPPSLTNNLSMVADVTEAWGRGVKYMPRVSWGFSHPLFSLFTKCNSLYWLPFPAKKKFHWCGLRAAQIYISKDKYLKSSLIDNMCTYRSNSGGMSSEFMTIFIPLRNVSSVQETIYWLDKS